MAFNHWPKYRLKFKYELNELNDYYWYLVESFSFRKRYESKSIGKAKVNLYSDFIWQKELLIVKSDVIIELDA